MFCNERSLNLAESIAVWVIQAGVVALFIALLLHARREGRRWVSTLLSGALFGWLAEFIIVHGERCPIGYDYACSPLVPSLLGVPVVVGLGWGAILYACTWTAQRMQLPGWLRPLVAGLLAVNIDLSLDPVATKLGFWTWYAAEGNWVDLLDRAKPDMSLYYEVPYDNFLGWFLITASYTASVRLLFVWRDWKRRKEGKIPIPGRDQWLGTDTGRYGLKPTPCDAWIPLAAVAGALVIMLGFKSRAVQDVLSSVQPSVVFVVALPVAVVASWYFARKSNRYHEIQWPVIVLPLFFHGYALLVLLSFVFLGVQGYEFDALIVAISFNTVAGFVAFAWPSLALLFPTKQEDALKRGRPTAAPVHIVARDADQSMAAQ